MYNSSVYIHKHGSSWQLGYEPLILEMRKQDFSSHLRRWLSKEASDEGEGMQVSLHHSRGGPLTPLPQWSTQDTPFPTTIATSAGIIASNIWHAYLREAECIKLPLCPGNKNTFLQYISSSSGFTTSFSPFYLWIKNKKLWFWESSSLKWATSSFQVTSTYHFSSTKATL